MATESGKIYETKNLYVNLPRFRSITNSLSADDLICERWATCTEYGLAVALINTMSCVRYCLCFTIHWIHIFIQRPPAARRRVGDNGRPIQ